ncbi:hypothetical protein ENU1_019670 [Entamoeba nuttalli P19]|uniref:Uncharacterized protein n=1 Tax=Entamoeba nuttalli (strain P19) TaxID=1076696 RepID=K2GI82_ENTNP|nr:hypothetical protein ENU1_019670 [Entamoeba nuttalli P19]EKE42486.1 hypothetical protein ENU1_019670 [Entamoeba nuttalli P19]|eukprot:XP_008855178.1 hypothetical protein ENU1_019670 [Entamoeba nuttalli P19]
MIGKEMKRECYVHSGMIFKKKGERLISKCGSCINMVGPSLTEIHCIIVGFFNVTDQDSPLYEIQDHAVVSDYEFFKIAATTTPWSNTEFTQITISEATCLFTVFPSIHILKEEKGISTVAVVNSNDIVEKIIYNGVEYFQNGHYFDIPFKDTTVSFQIVSITNKILKVNNMKLSTKKFVLDQRFPSTSHTLCQFSSTSKVYTFDGYADILWIFQWHFVELQSTGFVKLTDEEVINNGLILHSIDGKASLISYATTVFNFVMAYRELRIEGTSDAEWNLTSYKWGGYNYGTDSSLVTYPPCVSTGFNEESKWINETTFQFNISITVSKRCSYYLNSMLLNFKTDGNRILKFSNIRFKDFENKKTCKVASLYCDGMECNADSESEDAKWKPECVPRCGVCRVGYKCSVKGKCIKEEEINTRSACKHISIITLFAWFIVLIV